MEKIDVLMFIFTRGEVRFKDLEERFVKNPDKPEEHIAKQTLVKYLNELMSEDYVMKSRLPREQYFRYSVTRKGRDFITKYIKEIEKKAVAWSDLADLCNFRYIFDYLSSTIQAHLQGSEKLKEDELSKLAENIVQELANMDFRVQEVETKKELIGEKEIKAVIASTINSLRDLRFWVDVFLYKTDNPFLKDAFTNAYQEIRKTILFYEEKYSFLPRKELKN